MLKRVKGVAIIHLYDADGNKIKEFASIDYDNPFLWWLFAVIMIVGMAIIGHWA